jgi:hypothetical protein
LLLVAEVAEAEVAEAEVVEVYRQALELVRLRILIALPLVLVEPVPKTAAATTAPTAYYLHGPPQSAEAAAGSSLVRVSLAVVVAVQGNRVLAEAVPAKVTQVVVLVPGCKRVAAVEWPEPEAAARSTKAARAARLLHRCCLAVLSITRGAVAVAVRAERRVLAAPVAEATAMAALVTRMVVPV